MENRMKDDIDDLKINQALLEQRQTHTDEVIVELKNTIKKLDDSFKKLSENFSAFNTRINKFFYIGLGAALATSDPGKELIKVLLKTIGV